MIKKLTPIKAIRKYCLGCSAGSTKEVRLCPCIKCFLYPYRMGIRPTTYKKRQARKGVTVVEKEIESSLGMKR